MKISKIAVGVFVLVVFSTLSTLADESVITLEITPSSSAPGADGTWELFGRIDDTGGGADGSLGFSSVLALIVDIDFGTDGDAVTIVDGIGAINPVNGGPPVLQKPMGVIEVLYGQDISSTGNIVPHVGNSGDALIAFGTYSAGQTPGFGQEGNNFTDALYLTSITPGGGPAIDDDATFTVVRRIPEPTTLALALISILALPRRRH